MSMQINISESEMLRLAWIRSGKGQTEFAKQAFNISKMTLNRWMTDGVPMKALPKLKELFKTCSCDQDRGYCSECIL